MSDFDITAAESKATYQEIQDYVKAHTGLRVSQPNCIPEKEKAITEALKHFKMI